MLTQVEQGRLTIAAPDTVIADAVFVLKSSKLYNTPRPEVAALLSPLVRLPHFQARNQHMLLRALEIFGATTTLDFGDCCIIAAMEEAQATILYAFDKGYDKIPGITRREP